jgi:HSP20 family protein
LTDSGRWLSFPRRFAELTEEVDRLFDELIYRPWGVTPRAQPWTPSIDLYETPEALVLEADLPGVKPEALKLEVHGGDLVLEGERTVERSQGGGRFHFRERYRGTFARRMRLPAYVDKDRIRAEFKDGVLRVIMPKLEARAGRKEPS